MADLATAPTKMSGTGDDVSPADDELKQRRERGRNAQRAFRQRQITTINELRDRNQAMQSAIVSLNRVASRLGNAELNEAMRNVRQAAGLDDLEAGDGHDDDEAIEELPITPSGRIVPPVSSSYAPGHHPVTVLPRTYHEQQNQQQYTAASEHQYGYQTGRMSPRLGYGLWLEYPIRLSNPPVDIVPYLDTTTTLSSVLFWSGLFWGFKVLQAALGGNRGAAATAHKVFGEIVPMKPDRHILNCIHARLTFRKQGFIASDHPDYDPDGGAKMHRMMARTCEAIGTPLEAFLRPDQVESFSRERLGDEYRVIEQALQGLGTPMDLSRVQRLIDKMVSGCVCMGDGPRVRFEVVVTVLETWMNESIVS
ncbi:hypothetical protein B0J13DRAFT_564719 [Dactylonectria estremocensis]|uniref:BZIP domain-containing protein n=1 Tax=Dactylonectria estremocensis TaxID=1079267 RepID=A0A9P9DZ89_9HYPO|nr:hypothetical protein B0J13DRAFT_564719 [Dactylonectria estremocensis]